MKVKLQLYIEDEASGITYIKFRIKELNFIPFVGLTIDCNGDIFTVHSVTYVAELKMYLLESTWKTGKQKLRTLSIKASKMGFK